MNESEEPKRLYFIDNIRILLTFLVIMHHSMIANGGSGSWYFVDPSHTDELTTILFSIFAVLNQGFFMGFFFFISAYFVPGRKKKNYFHIVMRVSF